MKISVLLVMPPERRLVLLDRLETCGFGALAVSDLAEARRILQTRPAMQVVLTDEQLQDGNWLSVLQEVWRNQLDAETVVCTRLGEPGLWIHVLSHGAYELLVEPYDQGEVQRIIEGAAAHSSMRTSAAGGRAQPALKRSRPRASEGSSSRIHATVINV